MRTSSNVFFFFIAAGASMTRRSRPFGGAPSSFDQSSAAIGAAVPGRRRTHSRLER
jgi:hypothetical protein